MNPQMFGRYLLLDKVAAGGMAEVWRAKLTGEGNFQKIIAIKKILPHVSEDEDFILMFTDEANITSTMNHANIGQVSEFSKVGDVFYISMEYVSGRDLKSVWSWSKARAQIMPVELSAYIVSKMCDGLQYAHDHSIVHRDISPQNVLLSWEGDVKVIDFGIAKATEKAGKTRPGTLKGKFAYMAPEQIRGLPLDGRSDLFAIGICLYELVTGQRGFQAEQIFVAGDGAQRRDSASEPAQPDAAGRAGAHHLQGPHQGPGSALPDLRRHERRPAAVHAPARPPSPGSRPRCLPARELHRRLGEREIQA